MYTRSVGECRSRKSVRSESVAAETDAVGDTETVCDAESVGKFVGESRSRKSVCSESVAAETEALGDTEAVHDTQCVAAKDHMLATDTGVAVRIAEFADTRLLISNANMTLMTTDETNSNLCVLVIDNNEVSLLPITTDSVTVCTLQSHDGSTHTMSLLVVCVCWVI